MPTLPWDQINTVLLDMDGTLLDLHFDNHFWLKHLPQALAQAREWPLEQARSFMMTEYEKVVGTLSWYCLDYWADLLHLDIMQMKREIDHLISMREDTLPFLDALRESGREVILLTNAHPDSLSLKIEKTQLDQHIDTLVSTHQYGVTKESQSLWQALHQDFGFDKQRTLFVDDSLTILQAAKDFGIAHLLAVANPDSQQEPRDIPQFPATSDYRTMLRDIRTNRVIKS
jgi:5'-nucleotidase